MNEPLANETTPLDNTRLNKFFTDNLNRIYCAKQHMSQRFPEIAGLAHFSDISLAIEETIDDVRKQISRMDQIYLELGEQVSLAACGGMTAMIEEAFVAIAEQKSDTQLRDMSILFYMQSMESIEVASFQVLQILAEKMGNKEIIQLIIENLDEAKEDRTLMLHITGKYVN